MVVGDGTFSHECLVSMHLRFSGGKGSDADRPESSAQAEVAGDAVRFELSLMKSTHPAQTV